MPTYKKPVLTREEVIELIEPFFKSLPVEKYPMVAFGIRGLYGPNERGTWDDGNGFLERNEGGTFAIFPGNTDPTAPFRKGLGSLSSNQILWFKIGKHKGRNAFRQAADFLVDRDGMGKRLKAPVSCAFNWHDSLGSTTSSLGCQTNPKDVFPAVRELGYMLVRKYYPKTETFPYILVDAVEVDEAKQDVEYYSNTVSDKCLNLIKEFEGCYLKAYLDPVKVPTIGWGTIQYPSGVKVKMGDTCTQAEADLWLKHEVAAKAEGVFKLIRKGISQGQIDALVSFAYNLGIGNLKSSTLLKKLNAGAPKEEVAAEFLRWNKAKGKVLRGLTRRREAEKKLFLS